MGRSVVAIKKDLRNWLPISRQGGRGGRGGIIESLRGAEGGRKSGKFYREITKFSPHPRGLNNDPSLFKVTKREGSWEVDDDDLKSFCMVTIPCIQKRLEQLIK